MSIITCTKCSKGYKSDESACPKCGYTMTDEERDKAIKLAKKGGAIILAVVGIALAFGFYMFGGADAEKVDTPQQQAAPTATPTVAITTEQVREQVAALLAGIDGFKDTPTFKQCIYGCGDTNPGRAWNDKRTALQEQMTPELDVPLSLKILPSELWQYGMDYGKGNTSEAQRRRTEIEAVLKQ